MYSDGDAEAEMDEGIRRGVRPTGHLAVVGSIVTLNLIGQLSKQNSVRVDGT
jgi:hypothetical protein